MEDRKRQVIVRADPQAVTEEAAQRVLAIAQQAVAARGQFTFALSGGSTPKALFQHLAQAPYLDTIPWAHTHIFFGDERTVPPNHPDSNYRLAYETLLKHVPLAGKNVHRMAGEANDLPAAAEAYAAQIRQVFGLSEGAWPRFDLILLGMGDDGHTASLFPGTQALREQRALVVVNDVPQLKTRRISLTFPVLNHAANVLFLVTGQAKAARLAEVLSGGDYPSAQVQPVDGELVWLVDKAAREKMARGG